MRCSHCHSGRMKRAENFGAERMQCGSCGIVTKSAETRLTAKQQELINYVGMWPTERIEDAWEVTQDLDQNGIGKAINMSRSNVPRLVEPLITAGLVQKKKAHILDENNRVKSSKKWVYYLTREGRKHFTESRRAETFDAESLDDMKIKYGNRDRIFFIKSVDYDTDGEITNDELPQEFTIKIPSNYHYFDEDADEGDITDVLNEWISTETGFSTKGIVWIEEENNSWRKSAEENNPGGTVLGKFVARKDHPSGYYKKGDKALITIYEESADRNYDMYNNYIGPLFYKIKLIFDEAYFTYPANTRNLPLMATPQDIEQNWRMIDAETFEAEEPFICPECRRASTKSKTSQVCVRCESEYQAGLNPPMRVPWPGDDGYYAETFEASRSDLRRRRRTPFYNIERTDEDEDHDQNKYARINAGGALWEATYQALRDDGMSHEQAETFCNTKFFDQYYEYLIEGLRTPMRNLLNRLQKPSLGLTRKQRKSNRESRRRFERYFPDMDSEEFEAHEGGHIDEATYQDSFEAPNRYPVRPTRPSEDWPRPTPRPRRPNRRPNPRPRPARRPF